MPAIIKGGLGRGYIPVQPDDDAPVMKTVHGVPPRETGTTRTVYGVQPEQEEPLVQEEAAEPEAEEVPAEEELPVYEEQPEPRRDPNRITEREAEIERAALIEEFERLREKYEQDAMDYVQHAKDKANEIYEKTRELASQTVNEAREEAERIRLEAAEEGRQQGHEEGFKKGHEEGYISALKKCKETLVELKECNAEIIERKEQIYLEYEESLFDAIFEIANKITIDSFKKKDGAVIRKMLKAAGKRYRGSKRVKITLSQLDVYDEAEIEEELLTEIFGDKTLVEIELVKDAPEGTLIIDNGAEITDAGVQTQLKMIEQLGKHKYRDKTLTDLLQSGRKRPDDEDKPKAKKQAKTEEPEGMTELERMFDEDADTDENDSETGE